MTCRLVLGLIYHHFGPSRRSSQSILKEISPRTSLEEMILKLKLQYLATSCKELTHCKRLWCWEGLGAGGEGDNRGWDSWMASLTRWTWVWVNSGRWWWTGRPGMLWFMGSQRVGHNWATELNWTELNCGTWLSDFTFTFHFHALEKEMAAHSSVLAWRIPGTGKPGGLPSTGSHRVGHDWSDLVAAIKLYS